MHNTSRRTPHQPRGFTLTELLVTIGIIALLVTVVTVVSNRAFRAAGRVKLGSQLQIIEQALEAYKTEFGTYPITSIDSSATSDDLINANGLRGARLLCKALIAPAPAFFNPTSPTFTDGNQDGMNGAGFRVQSRSGVLKIDDKGTPSDKSDDELSGPSHGPYLAPTQFKYSGTKADGSLDAAGASDSCVILDANEKPILYYPVLNPQPVVTLAGGFIGPGDPTNPPLPMYRTTDNNLFWGAQQADFLAIMGDVRGASTPGPDGAINPATGGTPAETPAVRGKYILWSAGPDGQFGYNAKAKPADRLDDVTNFQQDQ